MAYENGNGERGGKLQKIGGLWKPKPGGKSKGSGSVSVHGYKQRFVILTNHRKRPGSNEPDYLIMSGDAPEVDTYTPRGRQDDSGDQRRERDDDTRQAPRGEDIPW